jgi:hypothetical protein
MEVQIVFYEAFELLTKLVVDFIIQRGADILGGFENEITNALKLATNTNTNTHTHTHTHKHTVHSGHNE